MQLEKDNMKKFSFNQFRGCVLGKNTAATYFDGSLSGLEQTEQQAFADKFSIKFNHAYAAELMASF